jgi:hypothetical protein
MSISTLESLMRIALTKLLIESLYFLGYLGKMDECENRRFRE